MKTHLLNCLAFFVTAAAFSQHSLTLEECRRLAQENNAQAKNGALEVKASRQARKAAITTYFPSISAGGAMFEARKNLMEIATQGGNLPVYDGNPASLYTATQFAYMPASTLGLIKSGAFGMVTAVQPVFAGGRIWNGNRLAALGEEISRWRERLIQSDIILKTEEQYWQIVGLDEKLKTIVRYEELLARLLSQVEDAFRSGLVMKNDVLKVRVKKSEVLLNKSRLQNGRTLAMMAFCQHLGVPYDSLLVLKDGLSVEPVPQALHVDHAEALKNRAEYALLAASVRAEELQSDMKLGEYLPQVGVGLTGLYMKLDENKGRTIGMAFGTVSVPISGWWEASHVLSARSVKEKIAENCMKENAELLLLQMEKAWLDLTEAHRQLLLSEEARAQAEENLKVNSDSYANGIVGVADLLEAQALFQQSLDVLTDAKSACTVRRTRYLQATGR